MFLNDLPTQPNSPPILPDSSSSGLPVGDVSATSATPQPAPTPQPQVTTSDNLPNTIDPQQQQQPADNNTAAPTPWWKTLLTGALYGLAGGAGARTPGEAIAGGVAGELNHEAQVKQQAQQKQQFQTQQQMDASNIRFRDAQSALTIAQAHARETENSNLDADLKSRQDDRALAVWQGLRDRGISPALVTSANHGDATAALSQLQNQNAGVLPPVMTLRVGDSIAVFNLQDLASPKNNSAALDTVNSVRFAQNGTKANALSPEQFNALSQEQREQLVGQSIQYWNPTATAQNVDSLIAQYNNAMRTFTMNADPSNKNTLATVGQYRDVLKYLNDYNSRLKTKADEAAQRQIRVRAAGGGGGGDTVTDDFGNDITTPDGGTKEYNKRVNSFKKDADNLAQTEQTYRQFMDIINTPDDKLTGAQSVVGLFNAIGISAEPLKGKGFRINNNTVAEHAEARGLGQSVYQKFLSLRQGDIVTPQQLKDYANIAMQARQNQYVTKYNEASAAGVNPSFLLPHGNGQQIDPATAKIFLELGGNDPKKAAAAAQKSGWKF